MGLESPGQANLSTGVMQDFHFKAPRTPPKGLGRKIGTGSQVCSCVRLRAAQEPRGILDNFQNFVNIAFDIDDDTCTIEAHKRESA